MLAFVLCSVSVCGCSSHRFWRNKQNHKITCWVFYRGNANLNVWSSMLSHLKYPLPSSQPPTSPFSNLLCVIEHYSPFDGKYLLCDSPKNCLWSSLVRGWWLPVHPPQHLFATALTPLSCLDLFPEQLLCPHPSTAIKARLRGPSENGWGCAGQRMMLQTPAVLLYLCACARMTFSEMWGCCLPGQGGVFSFHQRQNFPHLSPCPLQWQDQSPGSSWSVCKC